MLRHSGRPNDDDNTGLGSRPSQRAASTKAQLLIQTLARFGEYVNRPNGDKEQTNGGLTRGWVIAKIGS
eukprot:297426-Amphidinium_carterae.2